MTSQPDPVQVAQRMRHARKLAGFTQEEAAHDLDVAIRTYARWERGESQGFLRVLDRIAKLYRTTPEALLDVPADAPTGDAARLEAMERELRELRELLLDPERLRAAAEALADEAPKRRPRRKG